MKIKSCVCVGVCVYGLKGIKLGRYVEFPSFMQRGGSRCARTNEHVSTDLFKFYFILCEEKEKKQQLTGED